MRRTSGSQKTAEGLREGTEDHNGVEGTRYTLWTTLQTAAGRDRTACPGIGTESGRVCCSATDGTTMGDNDGPEEEVVLLVVVATLWPTQER